jgi:hypothetical protein
MPVIEGADLSTVSTKFPLWPEGAYKTTIKGSHFDDEKKNLIIVHRLREAHGDYKAGREYQNYINLKTNAGEVNEIGYQSIKKYFEPLLPEHANDRPPNTDLLDGMDCTIYISQRTGKDEVERNYVKRIVKG